MLSIDAIYQGGILKPCGKVPLAENQRVRVFIEPLPDNQADVKAWLASIQQMNQEIIKEQGFFPDSALEIAADRYRDE